MSAFLVVAVALAASWISRIPLAALAGVMLVIALDMVDRSVLGLIADIRTNAGKATESIGDFAIVAAVAIASLVVNVLAGVATGVAISVAIFAIKSSRKVVRSQTTRVTRQSLRQRNSVEMQLLQELGNEIALFDLEGQIFFGTADRLGQDVANRAGRARFVILDFGRVTAVDATGAHVVAETAKRLVGNGGQLILTGLEADNGMRRSLERGCPPSLARWVPDADRALEWCEEAVLAAAGRDLGASGELPLDRTDLCRDMDAGELAQLSEVLVRQSYRPGAILFRESEPGDCMYLLVHGMVSIVLRAPNDPDKTIRLVTFAPGVVFGELALLQGSPRSADGICDTECTVYSISRSALERLGAQNHLIAIKVYKALALILADRLRRTTAELRHAITQ